MDATPGPDVKTVEYAGTSGHDENPAVARVGDEEVVRRIEGDATRPGHDAGSQNGPH